MFKLAVPIPLTDINFLSEAVKSSYALRIPARLKALVICVSKSKSSINIVEVRCTGVLNIIFAGFEPDRGEVIIRTHGTIIAYEQGKSTTYGLYNAQERATLFIGAGTEVYIGMIVGENSRSEDMIVNVCKEKHLTNTRASGSDDALKLTPHKVLSLEQSLEFIADDELVEITPLNIRLRKKILDPTKRLRGITT